MNIYTKFSSGGTIFCDEDETKVQTDKTNKENVLTSSACLLLTKNQKIQNRKQNTTSKPGTTFVQRKKS